MSPLNADILRIEQQNLLYESSRGPIFVSNIIAAILSWYLTGILPAHYLVLWLISFSAVSIVRLLTTTQALQTIRISGNQPKNGDKIFLAGVFLSALHWGVASYCFYPTSHSFAQTVFCIIMTGICAGGMTSLCARLATIICFLAPILIPLMLRMWTLPQENGIFLFWVALLFFIICLVNSYKLHITIKDNIALRLQSHESRRQLSRQKWYDDLTDLPNRRLFQDQLDQELSRSARHFENGAVLFMDLDLFKNVNDSLGPSAGDQLIMAVGKRISETLRKEDLAARMGGDEFAVLLPQLDKSQSRAAQKAQFVAAKLNKMLSTPFSIGEQAISTSASIGISLFPEPGKRVDDVLKQADTAMNQAKIAGRNTVRFFSPEMQHAADIRLKLNSDIKKAIENNELALYFQPQVLADGTIIGAEGLLRWTHPEKGMISPVTFISIAEETGIIIEIGKWVLKTACALIYEWEQQCLLGDHTIAINVSAKEFAAPDFVERVIKTIQQSGISPNHLDIELTEGSLISSVTDTIEKIQTLRAYGIKFSVDDFGTGYSSLSYLKSLPLHTLKIDRSFVQDIANTQHDVNLVEIIIAMAKSLHLEVVAEGVETELELNYLTQKGCDIYQGYHFYRPLPVADFTALLRQKAV